MVLVESHKIKIKIEFDENLMYKNYQDLKTGNSYLLVDRHDETEIYHYHSSIYHIAHLFFDSDVTYLWNYGAK